MKKFFISIIISSVLITSIITIGIVRIKKENDQIDRESVTLREDLTVEFGKEVKVSSFIDKLNGQMLNDFIIETDELGTKEITFEFLNIKNKHKKATFNIEIIDKTAPKIYGGNSYTVTKGYKKDLTNLMLSGDNIDDNPIRRIEGKYDLNTIGDYFLTYVITDSSKNETKSNFILHVVEKQENKTANRDNINIEDVISMHKTSYTKIGIDVSKWQGEINWEEVKEAGVEFAIIRVGYQKDYDNKDYTIDPFFISNIEGAKRVNIPVGIYFYSYARTIEEAVEQAKWVREQIKDYNIELPIAFDWESWASFNTTNMSFYKINKIANIFLDTLAEFGYKGMLYGSKNYLETVWEPTKYDIWLAHYIDKTTYQGKYSIWQIGDTGRVKGINGAVDIDILYEK